MESRKSSVDSQVERWLKESERLFKDHRNLVPRCAKCGLSLEGAMGYVCPDLRCPTFLNVTC